MSSRRPPAIEGMTSLKVDNLTYRTTLEELKRSFGKFGEIGDIYIPRDPFTRESRGFAFVRYYDRRDAEDAIDSMDGKTYDGRELRCSMAKYGRPEGRQDRGGSRRGYDRHDRRRSRSRSRSRGRRRSRSKSRSRTPRRSRSRTPRKDSSRSRSPRRRLSSSPRRSTHKSVSPRRRSSSPLSEGGSRSRSRSRS